MIKNCPACIAGPMMRFDQKGHNPNYGPGMLESWDFWPWDGPPPANVWVCVGCGYHEPVGPDVEAQQEFRPRLF